MPQNDMQQKDSGASLPEVNAKNPIYPNFTKVTAKNVVAFFSLTGTEKYKALIMQSNQLE